MLFILVSQNKFFIHSKKKFALLSSLTQNIQVLVHFNSGQFFFISCCENRMSLLVALLLLFITISILLFQCEEQCPYGSYGQGCGEQCRCKRGACDPVDGRCSCPPGWTGRGLPSPTGRNFGDGPKKMKIYLRYFFSCWKI